MDFTDPHLQLIRLLREASEIEHTPPGARVLHPHLRRQQRTAQGGIIKIPSDWRETMSTHWFIFAGSDGVAPPL
jgi:hypothetical protein